MRRNPIRVKCEACGRPERGNERFDTYVLCPKCFSKLKRRK